MAELAPSPAFEAPTKMAAELERLFGNQTVNPTGALPDRHTPPAGVIGAVAPAPVPIVNAAGEIPAPAPLVAPIVPVVPVVAPVVAPVAPVAPVVVDQTRAEKLAQQFAATGATGAPGDPAKVAADKVAADAIAQEATRKAEGRLTKEEMDAAQKNMTIPAGTAFKKVRAENDDLELKLAEERTLRAAAEAKTALATSTDPEAVTNLQEQVKRYETELAAVKVEATESYQKAVTRPLAKTQAELLALAGKYKVSEGAIRAALSEPDASKRRDQFADLAETGDEFKRMDASRFEQLVTQLDTIETSRTELLAASVESAKTLTTQQTADAAASKQAIQRNWETALTTTREKLAKELPVFGSTGDEKWDSDLKAKLDEVQTMDIAKLSNEDLAGSMYKAQAVPMLMTLITDLFTQTRTQNDTITKLRGTSVPAGGGSLPSREVTAPPAPTTFGEAARTRLAGVLPP